MLTPPVLAFAAAALGALVATGLIAALARRSGFTAPFNPIVPQRRPPAALGGGAGIWLGLLAGASFLLLSGESAAILYSAALLPPLLLGLLDDARPLGPLAKLLLQILAAALATAIFSGGMPAPLALFAGIGLGVTLMNAINFLDVSDGFAAAVSAVSFFGLAWLTGSVAPLLVAGGCLGFLAWNRPPARIYMGDAGGHLLGMAGALVIVAAPAGPAILPAGACFAVALAELIQLVVVRTRKRIPFWRGSPDHLALRLQRAGLGKTGAALLAAAGQALVILAARLFAR